MDAPKSIRETEKNPKNPLFWAKKPKKTQKTPKTQKNHKKTRKTKKNHWAGFLKKTGFFPTLTISRWIYFYRTVLSLIFTHVLPEADVIYQPQINCRMNQIDYSTSEWKLFPSVYTLLRYSIIRYGYLYWRNALLCDMYYVVNTTIHSVQLPFYFLFLTSWVSNKE